MVSLRVSIMLVTVNNVFAGYRKHIPVPRLTRAMELIRLNSSRQDYILSSCEKTVHTDDAMHV